MKCKLILENNLMYGAEIELSPVELLIFKEALEIYTKDEEMHPVDRKVANRMLELLSKECRE